jgi:SAM-dependent methyltransferase
VTPRAPAEAYGAFAWAYDPALGNRFFKSIEPELRRLLDQFPPPGRRHLDLACGSGIALEWFLRRRYRSVGLDASLPMLDLARSRSKVPLIAGDMRSLPFRGGFSLVTSIYDSLNHLLRRKDLQETFHQVGRLLAGGGIFLFDVNHPDVYPRVWGLQEPFVSEGKDHRLEMETRWSSFFGRGEARISGWAMAGSKRVEIRERRLQRAWPSAMIRAALGAAGLEVLEERLFDPYREDDGPVKVIFAARKQGPGTRG